MIGAAAQLELADFIDLGAKTAEEIAKAKGLHATSLYRLLRGLASYGIFAEQEDGTFAQTPRSDALRKDVPHSAWGIAQLTTRPWAVRTWSELGHSIRVGTPAFEHVNGIQLFEYFNKHPNELELFAEAMRSFSVTPAPRWQKPLISQVSAPWRILEGARDSSCLWFCGSIETCEGFCSIYRRWLKVLRALSRVTA
jgi:hypothetical protein